MSEIMAYSIQHRIFFSIINRPQSESGIEHTVSYHLIVLQLLTTRIQQLSQSPVSTTPNENDVYKLTIQTEVLVVPEMANTKSFLSSETVVTSDDSGAELYIENDVL
jgi:hypothetical protein